MDRFFRYFSIFKSSSRISFEVPCTSQTMWHKLKDIFGYSDSRKNPQQNVVTGSTVEQTRTSEGSGEGSMTEQPIKQIPAKELNRNSDTDCAVPDSVPNVRSRQLSSLSDKGYIEKYIAKWEDEDCFDCKVTVSVLSFGLMLHLCRTFLKLRHTVPPQKVKYIYTANLSLFAMWLVLMKQEWYDRKVSQTVKNDKT